MNAFCLPLVRFGAPFISRSKRAARISAVLPHAHTCARYVAKDSKSQPLFGLPPPIYRIRPRSRCRARNAVPRAHAKLSPFERARSAASHLATGRNCEVGRKVFPTVRSARREPMASRPRRTSLLTCARPSVRLRPCGIDQRTNCAKGGTFFVASGQTLGLRKQSSLGSLTLKDESRMLD